MMHWCGWHRILPCAIRWSMVRATFGNVDGDNAAAMRYTEARMTDVSTLLLQGMDEDAVDFRETYDGEDKEPIVLPCAFPNLLANGSNGIAVGMATSIPPHNAAELCEAAQHLIKFPNAGFEKLLEMVPGPDFPTGGTIIEDRAKPFSTPIIPAAAAFGCGQGGRKKTPAVAAIKSSLPRFPIRYRNPG